MPATGRPLALNGAAGPVVLPTVSGAVPVLVMLTLMVMFDPVASWPKSRDGGEAAKPGRVPVPCRSSPMSVLAPPAVTVNERVAVAPPAAVGVKPTGTVSVPPACRVTGRAGGVTPKGVDVLIAVMVTVRVAVTVAVAAPVAPTATCPKSTGLPVRAAWAGRPKAISAPSRVPT